MHTDHHCASPEHDSQRGCDPGDRPGHDCRAGLAPGTAPAQRLLCQVDPEPVGQRGDQSCVKFLSRNPLREDAGGTIVGRFVTIKRHFLSTMIFSKVSWSLLCPTEKREEVKTYER